MSFVNLFEVAKLLGLAMENLDNPHSSYIFLQGGVYPSQTHTHNSISISGQAPEYYSCYSHQRQQGKGYQSHPGVHAQHDEDYAHKHKEVFKQINQDIGKHVIEHLCIVGDPGNQSSHWIVVKEPRRQGLEMGKKIMPQIKDYMLSSSVQKVYLCIVKAKAQNNHCGVY